MADVLRFADISQGTTLDLLGGTLKLLDNSWVTRSPPLEYDYTKSTYGATAQLKNFGTVVETMDLLGNDTTVNIRAGTNALEDILEGARLYHSNDLHDTSYWLEWNIDGESPRRSLLYEGAIQYLQGVGLSPFMENDKLHCRLALTRHPFWENTSATSISSSNVSCSGGMWHITGVPGTVPARPSEFQAAGSGGTIEELWVGIRDDYEGRSSFDPVWECEDGQVNSPYTDTSSAGGMMTCGFTTTAALTKRFSVAVEDVLGGNYNHMAGRYLVIARVKVTNADTTAGIQMKTGYHTLETNLVPSAERYIGGLTKWHLQELGYVQFPPGGSYHGMAADAMRKAVITIWAERVEGTGSLNVDTLYLVPSEHFFYAMDAAIVGAGNVQAIVQENDSGLVVANYSGSPLVGLNSALTDFYVPVGASVAVVVGQRNYTANNPPHNTADQVDLSLDYIPRWRSYRP